MTESLLGFLPETENRLQPKETGPGVRRGEKSICAMNKGCLVFQVHILGLKNV